MDNTWLGGGGGGGGGNGGGGNWNGGGRKPRTPLGDIFQQLGPQATNPQIRMSPIEAALQRNEQIYHPPSSSMERPGGGPGPYQSPFLDDVRMSPLEAALRRNQRIYHPHGPSDGPFGYDAGFGPIV